MANPGHEHFTMMNQFHMMLAFGIMVAYLSVPFTALRKLPVMTVSKVAGTFFFLTCALTHLAIAVGFHDNRWMILNDTVQLVSVVAFIYSLNRQVRWVIRRQKEVKARRDDVR